MRDRERQLFEAAVGVHDAENKGIAVCRAETDRGVKFYARKRGSVDPAGVIYMVIPCGRSVDSVHRGGSLRRGRRRLHVAGVAGCDAVEAEDVADLAGKYGDGLRGVEQEWHKRGTIIGDVNVVRADSRPIGAVLA